MRKIIFSLTLCMFGLAVMAQDSLVSNNGNKYLPKAGDIAVGIDGDPIFTYVGNIFNGTQNNKLNLKDDNTLYFRYYLKDDAAVRVRLRIASTRNIVKYNVIDDAAKFVNPLSNKEVEDRSTVKENDYELHVGYQQFRGYNRLKGFYGADLGFVYYKYNVKNEYGNKMNEVNPTPSTSIPGITAGDRIVEQVSKNPSKAISLGVFAGAEYYFMPKVCIGFELGLSYGKTWFGQEYKKSEHLVGSIVETHDKLDKPAGSSDRNLETVFPYSYGSFYFMIHF